MHALPRDDDRPDATRRHAQVTGTMRCLPATRKITRAFSHDTEVPPMDFAASQKLLGMAVYDARVLSFRMTKSTLPNNRKTRAATD